MIKLIVEDYCQDCERFEAHVEKEVSRPTGTVLGTKITCEHAHDCKKFVNYLSYQLNKKNSQDKHTSPFDDPLMNPWRDNDDRV